ncbi:MAG: hypothetical protein ABIJ20_00985 [Nanoarchaeota archaeon]|nr:hypothetical protein [Nanoarchaeota archaeon]MBU1444730.1 hypothetical protein [Nanoarchaeota archaeon]MBU2420774.1 hypothetical protein [Nanoarchaeota archaeon]MBU2475372.1 hypothetical protein [Nanoarchaeota archaeon]
MDPIIKIKENLGVICIGLFFASLWSIDKYSSDPLNEIFYVLVGLIAIIGGFLVFLFIKDFIEKFKAYKVTNLGNVKSKIKDSVDEEEKTDFKELEKKIEICRDRIELYEEFGKIRSLKIVRMVLLSFIFLVLGFLLYMFLPDLANGIKLFSVLIVFFITLYSVFKLLFIIYDLCSH